MYRRLTFFFASTTGILAALLAVAHCTSSPPTTKTTSADDIIFSQGKVFIGTARNISAQGRLVDGLQKQPSFH
jgi:hypothetical protein